MKKMTSIVLCALLVLSLFTACENDDGKQKDVEGILQSFSGSLIELKSTNGENLVFDVSSATLNATHGMVAGDDVRLTYTGKIKGGDTSGVTVLTVNDRTEKDPDLEEKLAQGSLVHSSMNTIVIRTAQGEELSFPTAMAEMKIKDGLITGNFVQVYYLGEIKNGDTRHVKVLRIVDDIDNPKAEPEKNPEAQHETKPAPGPQHTTDGGVLFHPVDQDVWATASVSVRSGPGQNYRRITGLIPKDHVRRTGYSDTGWSRIFLDGYTAYCISDWLTGIQPEPDKPDPKPAPPTPLPTTHKMEGVVTDATMNSTTIAFGNNEYTFATGNASHYYKHGMVLGNTVEIVYTGELRGTDTSGVSVISVTDNNENPDPTPPVPAPAPETETEPGPVVAPEPATEPAPEPEPAPPVVVAPEPVLPPAPVLPPVHMLPGGIGPVHPVPTLIGTVTGSTANTVTISTDDGATLTFSIDQNTQNNCGSFDVGARISVRPRTSAAGGGNVIPANSINPE
ncbi:MAG: SH3 domain-containing protein [Oscillospiraceae bacterium]